jgi:hypothetical protein
VSLTNVPSPVRVIAVILLVYVQLELMEIVMTIMGTCAVLIEQILSLSKIFVMVLMVSWELQAVVVTDSRLLLHVHPTQNVLHQVLSLQITFVQVTTTTVGQKFRVIPLMVILVAQMPN